MTYLPYEPDLNTLTEDLPSTVAGIVEVVQNTLIHIFWADQYGEKLSEERKAEVNTRSAAGILRQAYKYKPVNLKEQRSPSEKTVGNCRDFTVLTVAFMRMRGIPARARCGFGAYFPSAEGGLRYVDHWVAEYWCPGENRWILVDSQIDDLQLNALKIDFDTLDVPSSQFITGGAAWKLIREGEADPDTFGILDMHGVGFVKGNLIRDLTSLTKTPLLPWDCWGIILEENPGDVELLDRVAEATQPGTEKYDEIMGAK